MYSPTQHEFGMEGGEAFPTGGMATLGTPHTTVGAVPVRNSRLFNQATGSHYGLHHRHSSYGGTMAMSPPTGREAWFGTSLDSAGSSFGHSPIFGRDIMVSPSTSTPLDGFTGEDDEFQQRNLQEIFEKRRRRRESHNAVERRRRDNINERIHELSTLLPEHLLESVPASANVMSVSGSHTGPNGRTINKGTILKLSVDHIKELEEQLQKYKRRAQDLEQWVAAAKRGDPIPDHVLSNSAGLEMNAHTDSVTQNRPHQERIGSMQFQQQFGNLHIAENT